MAKRPKRKGLMPGKDLLRMVRLPQPQSKNTSQSRQKRTTSSSVVKIKGASKARWKFDKPDVMPCISYKVDVSLLEEGILSPIPIKETESAIELTSKVKATSTKTQAELVVSDYLSVLLDGVREVVTDAGRIDVLTNKYVIEVKEASDWKHGIGQVIVYSFYYPNKQPVLYLFGENIFTYKDIAMFHCEKLGITYKDAQEWCIKAHLPRS